MAVEVPDAMPFRITLTAADIPANVDLEHAAPVHAALRISK